MSILVKITDLNLAGKRVLLREDYNVPIRNGEVGDDTRIRASLPTLKQLMNTGAKIIIISHLGRPTEGKFDEASSMAPVARCLSSLLGKEVRLIRDWLNGIELGECEVVLCENARFEIGEKANDEELSRRMAELCDVYVNDAFATAHRAQASTSGVVKYVPVACAGPLLIRELKTLSKILRNPAKPIVAIVGGAKVSTKLTILESLSEKVDQLIVGGGIANTFLAGTADMGDLLASLGIDQSNAFNECPRELVLRRLFERPELAGIWRITHWAYSEPSDLWVVSRGKIAGHLMSSQGVRQGDPLAMLLFALVVHHLYRDTLDTVNQGIAEKSKDIVQSVAIADDIHFMGRPLRVIAAYDVFSKLATAAGLRINASKSKFLWKHPTRLAEEAQKALDARGIERVKVLKIFGTPTGRPDLVSKMCCDIVHKHARFWGAVLHPRLPHQHAHLLLRFSGIPRMNFLMRTVAPSLLAPALKQFDAIILGSVLAKLRIPCDSLPTAALKQIILPVRRGGAGLRSMERTHPAAYLGSFSRASYYLARLKFGGKLVTPSDNRLTLEIATCLRFIRRSVPASKLDSPLSPLLPPAEEGGLGDGLKTALGFFQARPALQEQLQRTLTKEVEDTYADCLVLESSPRDRARLLSCSGRWASVALTTLPLHSSLTIPDSDFEIFWRLRHGLKPIDSLPDSCSCGADMTVSGHPEHAMFCQKMNKTLHYMRHNMIRDAVSRVFSSIGAYTDSRCAAYEFIDGKTLDLAIFFADNSLALDMRVTSPTCDSHVLKAQRRLGAATAAEHEKESKYGDEVRAWGGNMDFSPFVLESYGAFGTSAQAVCKLAGTAADQLPTGWDCGEAVASCIAAAAVALHRGNGMAVRSCCRMASKALSGAGPGRPRGSKDRVPRRPGSGLRYLLH